MAGKPRLEMRRTGWDVALGALLVVAGLVILGNAAFATQVSVLFIGWMLVIYGVALAAGIVRLMAAFHDPLFRVPLVFSGVASTILGLVVLLDLFDATYVLLGHCLASTPWSTGSR